MDKLRIETTALITSHGTVLGMRGNDLYHAEEVPKSEIVTAILENDVPGKISLTKLPKHFTWRRLEGSFEKYLLFSIQDGARYICAEPGGQVCNNRMECGPWETFMVNAVSLFEPETTRLYCVYHDLVKSSKPVLLHLGPGERPKQGFLNIDGFAHNTSLLFKERFPDNYFIFPFADQLWPFSNDSVDYVYHEDFIEHISQISQWQVLAEALRVLKPGCIHRINTPCIKASMLRHSDFNLGFEGVYTGERQWGHIAMLTYKSLEEMALSIGYSKVISTKKNEGTSKFAIQDTRPDGDRDDLTGNIFVDLVK